MSFCHNVGGSGGPTACGARKGRGIASTVESLEALEAAVLPFAELGFALHDVQVFWFPMNHGGRNSVERAFNSNTNLRPQIADEKQDHDTSNAQRRSIQGTGGQRESAAILPISAKFRGGKRQARDELKHVLEPARPPDSFLSLPQWRWCHMGLILSACDKATSVVRMPDKDTENEHLEPVSNKSPKSPGVQPHPPCLYIILDLYETGVRVDNVLVASSSSKNSKISNLQLKKKVMDHCHPNGNVFSAGIREPTVQKDLECILDQVQAFEEWGYNPAFFNCQHFVSILFHRLTGKSLSKCLRHRWTSNRSLPGPNPNNLRAKTGVLSRAMTDAAILQDHLCVVDLDQLLFSYSPKFFDERNHAAAGVGLGLSMTSSVVGAASAVASSGSSNTSGDRLLHPLMWTSSTVALGMAVTAMGLGYDKIPRLCPLSRATIWFQYHPDQGQWVWSPYRSGDVDEGDRWISVRTHQVPRRPGATNHHDWATSSVVRCAPLCHRRPPRIMVRNWTPKGSVPRLFVTWLDTTHILGRTLSWNVLCVCKPGTIPQPFGAVGPAEMAFALNATRDM